MQEVNSSYTKIAPFYEATLGSIFGLLPNQIISFFDSLSKPSKLLDVGCGPGVEAEVAEKMGHLVTGLDLNKNMLERFKVRLPNSATLESSVTAIKSQDNAFDAVFCSCVLLHLDKGSGIKALNEIYRVLKPGGQIYLINTISKGEVEYHTRNSLFDVGVDRLFFYHWIHEELIQAIKQIGLVILHSEVPEPPLKGRPGVVLLKLQKPSSIWFHYSDLSTIKNEGDTDEDIC